MCQPEQSNRKKLETYLYNSSAIPKNKKTCDLYPNHNYFLRYNCHARGCFATQETSLGDFYFSYVLQWSCFSEAELRTFLVILNREEADYRRRIELKYQIRKREILRLMNLRAKYQQDINTVSATPLIVNDDGNSPTIATPPFSYGELFFPTLLTGCLYYFFLLH